MGRLTRYGDCRRFEQLYAELNADSAPLSIHESKRVLKKRRLVAVSIPSQSPLRQPRVILAKPAAGRTVCGTICANIENTLMNGIVIRLAGVPQPETRI